MRSIRFLLLVTFCVSCYPGHCGAADTFLRSVGVRGGLSATGTESYFHQYDAFGVCGLPWEFRTRSGWGVLTQLDFAAGMLTGEGRYGLVGSAGPDFSFGKTDFPIELDLGISAAGLSRDTFGNKDYNGHLQFISHAGIDFRVTHKLGLAYRFQHMSNAGLNGWQNPGLNMHMFGLNWYFAQ